MLVGPTASGKSAAAVELALQRCASGRLTEIVSCDSMAVYRGMDIGTATPNDVERRGVPHHLLDVVEPSEEFSVQRFVELVNGALDDIESRGADAVLVGGTGLYVQAIVDGLRPPPQFPDVAAELELLDTTDLEAKLNSLDPVASARVPPGNRRRLIRALEVTIGSGRPFSSYGPGLDAYPDTPFVFTGLTLPRDVMAARIAARYLQQMDAGFLAEVIALSNSPAGWSRTAAAALGYRELVAHLRGEMDLADAVALAVQRTRRFAVRQERWFRRDPRIEWFAATSNGGDPAPPAELARSLGELWDRSAQSASVGPPELDPDSARPATTVEQSCCE